MDMAIYSRTRKSLLQILKSDCPTGRVNEKQLKTYFGDIFPVGNVTKYTQLVFKSIDKMGTGEIGITDFLDFLCLMSFGSIEQRIVASFHLFDTDKDGLISRCDLFKVFLLKK